MKRIIFDKRLSFNKIDIVFEEEHFLYRLPDLDEVITKRMLQAHSSKNSVFVFENWHDFEQFVEYDDCYGTEFYGVSIHFVKKSNSASYVRFKCRRKIDKFVIYGIVDKNESMFDLFEVETDEFRVGRLKRRTDLSSRNFELSNFYKCTPLNDHPFKVDICYVTDEEAFCLSVQTVIHSLYPTIKSGAEPRYVEKLSYYTNFHTGIVEFSFESDRNLYHHMYERTDFSGMFCLSDLTGSLFNDGSEMYSSK
jgi:hypothetical protein